MSAWIEIKRVKAARFGTRVALLVSAWIEIVVENGGMSFYAVALLVSAWIEIMTYKLPPKLKSSHSS